LPIISVNKSKSKRNQSGENDALTINFLSVHCPCEFIISWQSGTIRGSLVFSVYATLKFDYKTKLYIIGLDPQCVNKTAYIPLAATMRLRPKA